jgi:hypothetical protein
MISNCNPSPSFYGLPRLAGKRPSATPGSPCLGVGSLCFPQTQVYDLYACVCLEQLPYLVQKIDNEMFRGGSKGYNLVLETAFRKKAEHQCVPIVTEKGMIKFINQWRDDALHVSIVHQHAVLVNLPFDLDGQPIRVPMYIGAAALVKWQAVAHFPTKIPRNSHSCYPVLPVVGRGALNCAHSIR